MAPDTQSIDFNATFYTVGLALVFPFDSASSHSESAGSETLSAAIRRSAWMTTMRKMKTRRILTKTMKTTKKRMRTMLDEDEEDDEDYDDDEEEEDEDDDLDDDEEDR